MGQSGNNLEVNNKSVYRVRPSAECVRYRPHVCRAWASGLLHDDRSGLNALPVQPEPIAWPGDDETGSTERHAACGFSIMLERCCIPGA